MNWNLEGMIVDGMYMGAYPCRGKVLVSRVKYGGEVCHHVVLETPITIYGSVRDRVILDHKQVVRVQDDRVEDSRYDDQFELDTDYN